MKKQTTKDFYSHIFVLLYIILYCFVSYLFLTDFPWVHSDESWLAGLSRNMSESMDFSATESFFDAKQRYPHAIKILFHALQITICSFTGYSIVPLRLISLISCAISLYLFYLIAKKLFHRSFLALGLTIIFSFDLQFIYISHIARQEILLLLSLMLCLYLFFQENSQKTVRRGLLLGIVTGLSVGLHPNSFLIATTIGCCYLSYLIMHPYDSKKPLFTYIGTTGSIAGFFVALSYCFDSQFLTHYFANGVEEFGIDASFGNRLSGLFAFFRRLFLREGGTYYIAEIRLQLLLFLLSAVFMLIFFLFMPKEKELEQQRQNILTLLFAGYGVIAGIFLIGRFNQLSIIFLFPIGWLLVFYILTLFEEKAKTIICILLFASVCFISVSNIKPFLSGDTYENYLDQIASFAAPEDEVIANLNMGLYFDNDSLHDYRNLPYVMQTNGSLDAYIEQHQIEYIFYSTELSYYYEHRPYYNALYGNILFAEDLLRYCEEECDYLGSFYNARYAPRILELLDKDEYSEIKVYKTKFEH